MQHRPLISFAILAGLTFAGVIGACSGDVQTQTNASGTGANGGGGGGTGGIMTTTGTVSSTNATGTGPGPASSSSGTVGDVCMQACAHAEMCFGFDVCSMLGNLLDCSNPQNECIGQCVLDTPCAQLGIDTLQTCQSQCQGDAGVMDGGSPMACGQCAQGSCGQAIQGCFQVPGCGSQNPNDPSWLNCIFGCGQNPTPQCYTDCDTQFANAAPGYEPVYQCLCTSCTAECGFIDPCSHVPDGGP